MQSISKLGWLSETTATAIRNYANNAAEEVCGLLLRPSPEEPVYFAQHHNLAPDRANGFMIDSDVIAEARADDSLVAVVHSHWSEGQAAKLSRDDIRQSKATQLPYLLYHSGFDSWDYFDPANYHPYPLAMQSTPDRLEHYTGWPFVWDRSDCYSIIRAYYAGRWAIELNDTLRIGEDSEAIKAASWNQINDSFADLGFRKVDLDEEELQDGDIAIVALVSDTPHHCIILADVTKNTGLHAIDGKPSEQVFFGESLQRRTRFYLRHAQLEEPNADG